MLKTVNDGFMARHINHYAKPDYPSFATWRMRIEAVDNKEKDVFLQKMDDLWSRNGQERMDPDVVTRYGSMCPLVLFTFLIRLSVCPSVRRSGL